MKKVMLIGYVLILVLSLTALLWSSFFVTLVAKKMIGLLLRGYWSCQLLSRVLRTACAAYP